MSTSRQFSLPFVIERKNTLQGFYPGANQELLGAVENFIHGQGPDLFFVYGDIGVGKSHILQGALRDYPHQGYYLPMASGQVEDEWLKSLPVGGLICIDDVDWLRGQQVLQQALLDLFERNRSSGGRMLVASKVSASHLELELKDIGSRLGSGLVYRLKSLADAEKPDAFRWCARRRGLDVNADAIEWLLRRAPRDPATMFRLLEEIDRAALDQGARVTIPFLKRGGFLEQQAASP